MAIKRVDDFDVTGKRVLIRVDFNVPLDGNQNVTDDTRLKAVLPTIRYVVGQGGKAILASHLGRPKGQVNPKYTLKPIAGHISKLLGYDVPIAPDCVGPEVKALVDAMAPRDVLLLENLRYHAEEEKNDPAFAKDLASLCDIYINDAFGAAHRAHASITGVADLVKDVGTGFLMKQEVKYLDKLVAKPERPFLVVLGGVKVSDKIGVIKSLLNIGDVFLIGGAMANTFLKAQGLSVGKSKFEEEKLDVAREILNLAKEKGKTFILPSDVVVTRDIASGEATTVPVNAIPDDAMAVDIGEGTNKIFCYEISNAKTLFWNGPMGLFETPPYDKGTFSIAKCIASETGLISVVGGGDSASAARKSGHGDGFTHICTGGGATLEFLEGLQLPGLKSLDRY